MIGSKLLLNKTIKLCRSLATPLAQNSKLIKSYANAFTYSLQFSRCQSIQQPIKYKQFERYNNGDKRIQISKKYDLLNLSMFRRKEPKKTKKRTPKLILLQNPFTWLMTKINLVVLRRAWDPAFRENDFKYGTTQVVQNTII